MLVSLCLSVVVCVCVRGSLSLTLTAVWLVAVGSEVMLCLCCLLLASLAAAGFMRVSCSSQELMKTNERKIYLHFLLFCLPTLYCSFSISPLLSPSSILPSLLFSLLSFSVPFTCYILQLLYFLTPITHTHNSFYNLFLRRSLFSGKRNV